MKSLMYVKWTVKWYIGAALMMPVTIIASDDKSIDLWITYRNKYLQPTADKGFFVYALLKSQSHQHSISKAEL